VHSNNFSRRAFVLALGGFVSSQACRSQDFKVADGDAEATASKYILDLTANSIGWFFWLVDRNFVRERTGLKGLNKQEQIEALKKKWTLMIDTDRQSGILGYEPYNEHENESAWMARHPEADEYGDPSNLCWLVFRKNVQIGPARVNGKKGDFGRRKTLYVDIPFHYLKKDDSPRVNNQELKREMKLQGAKATLWVQRPDQGADLWVYDSCYLSDLRFWT
jgi:hypothetical protein